MAPIIAVDLTRKQYRDANRRSLERMRIRPAEKRQSIAATGLNEMLRLRRRVACRETKKAGQILPGL
jgi:hypothetical protein